MADLSQSLIEHDLTPGKVVQISPLVRRITANNASIYTGPGTNTYLIGTDKIAVIDPGPADDKAHIEAILSACDGKIYWLLATHTHIDHSPAIAELAEHTGAELIGIKRKPVDEFLDANFNPDNDFADGQTIHCDEFSVRAIATPGHVDNHLCFLLENEMMLFSGDHIMQGATVVIVTPHGGCMSDYMASVAKLIDKGINYIAPAHGHIMDEADAALSDLYQHRLKQEQKILRTIRLLKKASLKELAQQVYPNVDIELNTGAQIILWSHLEKLGREGFTRRANPEFNIKPDNFTEDVWLAIG